MRFLHFATNDVTGGAAKASYRLHSALHDAGHESRIFVRNRHSTDPSVTEAPRRLHRTVLRRAGRALHGLRAEAMFNFDPAPDVDTSVFYRDAPGTVDALCLHWISEFLPVREIRRLHAHYRAPLLWTLLDMEPLTGGCHYPLGCAGFTDRCGFCPQLDSSREEDHSRRLWRRKAALLAEADLTLVAPTRWLAERARESSLYHDRPVAEIPLPIDPGHFHPGDAHTARRSFELQPDRRVLLVGASALDEPRKGMAELREALRRLASLLSGDGETLPQLLVMGEGGEELLAGLPYTVRRTGYLRNESDLVSAYQAADLYVSPSLEDAGPMMVPEAMLCGTPVVAFRTGGAPDVIRSGENGYIAALGDAEELARGMAAVLSATASAPLRAAARAAAVARHDPARVATLYAELVRELQQRPDPPRLPGAPSR